MSFEQPARLVPVSLANYRPVGERPMQTDAFEANEAACDTDLQLVARVQQGDRRAFDLLVVKYQARVMALISRYVRNPQDVRDVAQDAFVKAYRSIAQFRGDSAFYTWLYRIAVNSAFNHIGGASRMPSRSLDAEEYGGSDLVEALTDRQSPEEVLAGRQLKTALDQAIAALPEELRVALLLREVDGLSYEDIMDIQQCPLGTVRSRIFRARDQVMKAVGLVGQAVSG